MSLEKSPSESTEASVCVTGLSVCGYTHRARGRNCLELGIGEAWGCIWSWGAGEMPVGRAGEPVTAVSLAPERLAGRRQVANDEGELPGLTRL